MRFSKVRCCCR